MDQQPRRPNLATHNIYLPAALFWVVSYFQSRDTYEDISIIHSDIHIELEKFYYNTHSCFCTEFLKISDLYAVNLGLSYTPVVKKWKEFGLTLGVSNSSLSVIEIDLSGESQHCLTEVLAKWLNGEGSPSTWREAIKATLSLSKNSKQIIQYIPKSIQGKIELLYLNT